MATSEVFNQKRMDRCLNIQQAIMDRWRKSDGFRYIARATQSLDGMTLDDLRKQYFAVGCDENDLVEIPFLDMLVIFDLIRQTFVGLKNRTDESATLKLQVTTDFSDRDAVILLSSIEIETPFDTGKYLRLAADPPLDVESDEPPF